MKKETFSRRGGKPQDVNSHGLSTVPLTPGAWKSLPDFHMSVFLVKISSINGLIGYAKLGRLGLCTWILFLAFPLCIRKGTEAPFRKSCNNLDGTLETSHTNAQMPV